MQLKDNCQYSKAQDRLKSKECINCMGLGFIYDDEPNEWECTECSGTGYGMILPRPDADKALKKMIKTLTPEFMRDIPLESVKQKFDIIPTNEIIFEDYDEGILILKLFRDIIICIRQDDGFAWIEYENH